MYGLILDDCNFHECVNTSQFDTEKILVLRPPDGEVKISSLCVLFLSLCGANLLTFLVHVDELPHHRFPAC